MTNISNLQNVSNTFKKFIFSSKNQKQKRDYSSIINYDNPYDLKEQEIEEIEKLTNSTIIQSIGNGGFSTVKLIYHKFQNTYFAMKIVY